MILIKLITYYNLNNGKKEGVYKWYHDDELTLGELSVYKDGERDGEFKKWDENRNLKEHSLYKDGKFIKNLLPSNELREKISIGNINYHYQKHLAKFENILFDVDESEFDKYITPRNKYNTQIGWNLRINKKVIEFKSTIHSLDETKKRAFEFLKLF
jgi:hypothetical protein